LLSLKLPAKLRQWELQNLVAEMEMLIQNLKTAAERLLQKLGNGCGFGVSSEAEK